MTTSFWLALVLTFPYLMWEIWKFISPALYEYANSVMAKYEDYLDSESALDCIKNIYDDLCA